MGGSMRRILECSICKKPLQLIEKVSVGDGSIFSYKCGHSFFEDQEEKSSAIFDSVDGSKHAREYQKTGVQFILDSGFNCIIGDQMRLGKTPQSLLALASDKNRFPCLILVRGANFYQWIEEYKTWTNPLPNGIFPIIGSKGFIPPGFSAYILSMDTLSKEGMVDKLLKFGFRLVIADEAHSFKNTTSKRSQALIQFLHEISVSETIQEVTFSCFNCQELWTEEVKITQTLEAKTVRKSSYCSKCNSYVVTSAHKEAIKERKCGVILLTGTPIKNRADEFFVLLNIVAPTVFPSLERFRKDWCMQDGQGKWSRIATWRYDQFKKLISPFFLRREKEDVYSETPALNRMYTVITIEDEALKKAYNRVLDKMEREAATRSNYTFFDSIGDLVLLRRICGIAKAKWVAEYVEEQLDNSEKSKIAVGIHHHDVKNSIAYAINGMGCLTLTGQDSAERKFEIMKKFETSPEQVLLINSLAGGVGMDFHYVDNVLVVERQWSPADDEQFEFRFYNPDKSIKNRPTNIEYVLAKGTLDEWWHEMLRSKYLVYGETIGTNWDPKNDPQAFKELLQQTLQGRL